MFKVLLLTGQMGDYFNHGKSGAAERIHGIAAIAFRDA
jgi:hypothetical protein